MNKTLVEVAAIFDAEQDDSAAGGATDIAVEFIFRDELAVPTSAWATVLGKKSLRRCRLAFRP